MACVWIPPLLRDLTGRQATVNAPGRTVGQVLDALDAVFPGFKERLLPGGRLSAGLAVVVDGRVAPLGLRTPVDEESQVRFVPSPSGG